MNWVHKVLLLAGGLAVGVILLNCAMGFGWFSLMAGLPTFFAVTILVPFFLGVRDRKLAIVRRRREGKRRKNPRRRMSRPVPAVASAARAPLAERGGRVLETLPAAPL
jgi:hypothetical protein